MHELANMAATKAQEMNLPPPPAEFVTPVPTPTEKVFNCMPMNVSQLYN